MILQSKIKMSAISIFLLIAVYMQAQYVPLKNIDMRGIMWATSDLENCSGTNPLICPTYNVDGMNWYMSGVISTPFAFIYSPLNWMPINIANRDYAMVYQGNIEVRDPDGAICFNTPVLNISGLGPVTMNFSVSRPGNGTTYNWVNFSYRVNGGTPVSSGNLTGGQGVTSAWNPSATGNTLELWACMSATGNNDVYRLDLMNTNLGGVLPVKWSGTFASIDDEKNVHVMWATASEVNNDFFDIEKSMDGTRYETIGTVKGAGQSDGIKNYSYIDKDADPGNTYYYRIKQVDYDGRYEYSIPLKVEIEPNSSGWNIGPNPVQDRLSIYTEDLTQKSMDMEIYSIHGKKMKSLRLDGFQPVVEVDISDFPSGTYFISSNDHEGKRMRFVKILP